MLFKQPIGQHPATWDFEPSLFEWHGWMHRACMSPGIFFWHFPGQERPRKRVFFWQVLESSGNLKKYFHKINKIYSTQKSSGKCLLKKCMNPDVPSEQNVCSVLCICNFVLLCCRVEIYPQFLYLLLLGGLEHPVSQNNVYVSLLHVLEKVQSSPEALASTCACSKNHPTIY